LKLTQLYESVTQSIIRDLEAGVPSWTKPWRTPVTQLGTLIPHNYATRRAYHGINIAILWMARDAKTYLRGGFTHQRRNVRATARQWDFSEGLSLAAMSFTSS